MASSERDQRPFYRLYAHAHTHATRMSSLSLSRRATHTPTHAPTRAPTHAPTRLHTRLHTPTRLHAWSFFWSSRFAGSSGSRTRGTSSITLVSTVSFLRGRKVVGARAGEEGGDRQRPPSHPIPSPPSPAPPHPPRGGARRGETDGARGEGKGCSVPKRARERALGGSEILL